MPLHLVVGRPNSGKTELLYRTAESSAEDGVPTFVLPSEPDVVRARRDLCFGRGMAGLRIQQIDRYLQGLWEIHGDGRRIVTPTQRSALLKKAIAQSEIHKMTASAETSGFVAMLERLASLQTQRAGSSGDRLSQGVIECLVSYDDALLENGLVELSEATAILAARAGEIPFDGPIMANRFDDLTDAQELFLTVAAAAGADVWLALTWDAGLAATEATDPLVMRLTGVASRVHQCEPEVSTGDELAAVQATLFAGGPSVEAAGMVAISEAYGEEAEAERIVAEIVALRREGFGCGDIAVIYRDTKRHHAALRRAFEDAEISADFDVRLRFGETGFGRAVLALLAFVSSRERRSLVAFLGSGFSGLAIERVDELDARWRRRGVTQGARPLLRDIEDDDRELVRLLERAIRLSTARMDAASALGWKQLAGALLARRYGRDARTFADEDLPDAAAHRRFCEAVDDLSELSALGCDPLELREIIVRAQVALPARERDGHVQVMDVERVRGRRFRCVIIAGLVAGEFPRKPREGLFNGSRFAEELLGAGVSIPRDGGVPEERLLFYLAVSRAKERLVLSHQVVDSDGRPLRTSSFVEEFLALYAPDAGPVTRTLAFADLGVHPAAPDLARRALRTVAMAGDSAGIEMVRRAQSRAHGTPAEITDDRVLEQLAAQTSFTVTELEKYLQCPHRWFYERFINPRPLEEEVDARVEGTLVHQALRDFYAELPELHGIRRVTPETLGVCTDLATSVVERLLAEELDPERLSEQLMARRVGRVVAVLIERDARFLADYTPTYLEWSFGRGDDPPIDFEGFSLRGQIDRIDTYGDRFVVLDYKTGKVVAAARFETDGLLQAPLYAEAVRLRLGGVCAGSFYRGLKPAEHRDLCRGMYDASLVSDAEFTGNDGKVSCDDVVRSATERAAAAARGIRSGLIPREPISSDACKYCGASSWCREALS